MKRYLYAIPHVITLAGLASAALALMALFAGDIAATVRFSLLVLLIDRFDGTLARTLKVREKFPGVSGEVLDTITDLVGLTFVPMVFFWRQGLFLEGTGSFLAIGAIVTASWKYSRKEKFLKKGYSVGAPPVFFSAFLFYFLHLPPAAATVYVAALIGLAWSPVKYPITSLVTTHWQPGYKSVTNYLTILFFVPVFIMLDSAPAVIFWAMLTALLVQLYVYPLLMRAKIINPGFNRSY
jgi:phosphatidylcholine synthase